MNSKARKPGVIPGFLAAEFIPACSGFLASCSDFDFRSQLSPFKISTRTSPLGAAFPHGLSGLPSFGPASAP